MKKMPFDWKRVLEPLDSFEERRAKAVLENYRKRLLALSEVQGFGVSSKHGEPYIFVFVKPGSGSNLQRLIPDKLADFDVYYLEGQSTPQFLTKF